MNYPQARSMNISQGQVEHWPGTERLPSREIGARLRNARVLANMSRSEAAKILHADRAVILAAEDGRHRISSRQLDDLAHAYGTTASAILRHEAVHIDLVSRFREQGYGGDGAAETAAHQLNIFVAAEMELEHVLGMRRNLPLPPEIQFPLDRDKGAAEMAETAAYELRNRMELGTGPVGDLASLLDHESGIRVYAHPLNSKISCLYAFDERAGACMLLDSSLPRQALALAAAHGLGHFMVQRRRPFVLTTNTPADSAEERFVARFSRCFLVPPVVARRRFGDIFATAPRPNLAHYARIASEFCVPTETMVLRLEELGFVREGLSKRMIAKDGIASTLSQLDSCGSGQPAFPAIKTDVPLPARLARLAKKAGRLDYYGEGQLAEMLDLDRIHVRRLIYKHISEWEASDGKDEMYMWA